MLHTDINRAPIKVKANAGNSPRGTEGTRQKNEPGNFCKERPLDVAGRYSNELRSSERI